MVRAVLSIPSRKAYKIISEGRGGCDSKAMIHLHLVEELSIWPLQAK